MAHVTPDSDQSSIDSYGSNVFRGKPAVVVGRPLEYRQIRCTDNGPTWQVNYEWSQMYWILSRNNRTNWKIDIKTFKRGRSIVDHTDIIYRFILIAYAIA